MKVDYSLAFTNGQTVETDFGGAVLRTHVIGDLTVPTGRLIACDPFVNFDSEPFVRNVPVGNYPLDLSVVDFNDGDQRVGFSRVRLSNAKAIRWELALVEGQDLSDLENGNFFGYPVDSGTGCFMDAETAKRFRRALDDETYTDLMMTEMKKNYVDTWDWCDLKFDETSGNLITFKSGLGDGVYPSFFGFDSNEELTELLTDFFVIDLY